MIALFAGTLLGLIISIPVGPINLTVLTKGMRDGFKPAFWTGVGSATMEFIYCLLAMFGISAIVEHSLGNLLVQIVAFAILVYFGFRNLIVHPRKIHNGETMLNNGNGKVNFIKKYHIQGSFLVGMVLYALNPTFVIFWITVAGIVKSTSLISNSFDNLFFALGVGLGVVLWFYLLLKFIHNFIEFRARTIALFHRISGVIILFFASYLAYEILRKLI
jgi:threonine/homoserine/homoserine lactone efflux protein